MNNQKVAQFYGAEINVVNYNGEVYVAMKPVVEGIGLSWQSQYNKLISEKEKFNCIDINTIANDGKRRSMICIPLKKLNGWLFSINSNKVRSDLKEKVELYQDECSDTLYKYWFEGVAKRKPLTPSETLLQMSQQNVLAAERLVEQEQRTLALEKGQAQQRIELDEVKERQDKLNGDTGYMTALAFCKTRGINAPLAVACTLGRKSAKMCRKLGITVGKIPDERYGSVGSYPVEVLEQCIKHKK